MAASSRLAICRQLEDKVPPAQTKSAEQLEPGLDEQQQRISPDPESPAAAA